MDHTTSETHGCYDESNDRELRGPSSDDSCANSGISIGLMGLISLLVLEDQLHFWKLLDVYLNSRVSLSSVCYLDS